MEVKDVTTIENRLAATADWKEAPEKFNKGTQKAPQEACQKGNKHKSPTSIPIKMMKPR